MGPILVASIVKTFTNGDPGRFESTMCSFDRDKLVAAIELKHDILLLKDEKDDFPYFTDGGFKYIWTNSLWTYNIVCFDYKVIE